MLVAGAGPAGSTLARLLALRGVRVVLVDGGRRAADRLELVAPRALSVLRAAGQDDALDDPDVARRCLGIRRTWSGGDAQDVCFLRSPEGRGFTIARAAFDQVLLRRAAEAGAEVVAGEVRCATRSAGGVTLRLASGQELHGVFAVDATGRAAAVSRRLGARRSRAARAVAERVDEGADDEDQWLRVDWRTDGWFYGLAGPYGRSERWRVSSSSKCRGMLGQVRTDASSLCLDRFCGDRWLAVGDSSISFDPLASQGLAHAMTGAIVAAGKLARGHNMPARERAAFDAFNRETWNRYEQGLVAAYAPSARLSEAPSVHASLGC